MKNFITKFYPIGLVILFLAIFQFGNVNASQIINNSATPTQVSSTNGNFIYVTTTYLNSSQIVGQTLTLSSNATTTGNQYIGGNLMLVGNSTTTGNSYIVGTLTGSNVVATTGTISTLTQNSVLFAGANGVISQDNTNFTWNDSTNLLEIGSATTTDNFSVHGYSKIGDSAPFIQTKVLTSTTSASLGGTVNIASGLTGVDKILDISVLVEYTTNGFIPPEFTYSAGYQYSIYWDSSGFVNVLNSTSNSGNILDKPIRVFITYGKF